MKIVRLFLLALGLFYFVVSVGFLMNFGYFDGLRSVMVGWNTEMMAHMCLILAALLTFGADVEEK